LTTVFKLTLKKEPDLQMIYMPHGDWDRDERVINLPSMGGREIDLHDIIVGDNRSFGFLTSVYKRGDLVFSIPDDFDDGIVLRWSGSGDRPRVSDQKVKVVNFAQHETCILPTDRLQGRKVLLQTYARYNSRVLYLSLVEDGVIRSYDDHSDFLDTAAPTIEVVFTRDRHGTK
jgi:hypothetical protein